MNEEQTQTLPLKAAYSFGALHGLEHEVTDIREMVIEWDSSYTSSLRRGYIVALFEKHGLLNDFKQEYWSFGYTPAGEKKRLRYLRIKAQYEAFLAAGGPENDTEDGGNGLSDDAQAVKFALEAHLRDFLAKNLDHIESGLRLYDSREHNGVEFPIESGRIDLLAVDKSDKFVVIELKLSQGRNKTLGQLLYYMGWVDEHLGNGPCRGFIIASDITEDLSIAATRVPGIKLAEYRMSFAIDVMPPHVSPKSA